MNTVYAGRSAGLFVLLAACFFRAQSEEHLTQALASDECADSALSALQTRALTLQAPNATNATNATSATANATGTNASNAASGVANVTKVSVCTSGAQIPFSNRGPGTECFASALGEECSYQCEEGYIGVGRHVCQTIMAEGQVWKDKSFFGGNCWRLCADSPTCTSPQVPMRVNSTDASGWCMKTTCFDEMGALMNIAEGNYEVWKLARDESSGCYADHVNLDTQTAALGSSDATGMGIIMECIADAMGWISRDQFLQRVNQTLSAYAGIQPGNQTWNFRRGPRGWVPRFFDIKSGDLLSEGTEEKVGETWSVMSTGLFYSGVLFVQTYLKNTGAYKTNAEAGEIMSLAARMMDMVDWHSMLCYQAFASDEALEGYNGTGIPFLMDSDGQCRAIMWPERDGYYPFNEQISADWIATARVCFQSDQFPCSRPAMVNMWKAVVGRASHPNVVIDGYPILSDWPAYIVQLPYYTVNMVNSDATFLDMFKNGWLADWADYNSSVFYGGSNRYGMGAGPDMEWCSGATYFADRYTMNPADAKCRTWSPYSVAGWLPAAPDTIKGHLLEMLATGEAVYPFPGTDKHILWRKSILDPSMNWSSYVTTIDIAGELFGLSTLKLGVDFFRKNTNHFSKAQGFHHLPTPGPLNLSEASGATRSLHLKSSKVAQWSLARPSFANPAKPAI
mmetsp:Transcript_81280/g.195040  ORF Transcript_81280/g.195040 Transcript_81280/m.195040 type:complete len:680 (-) Transcript_81280:175-2214(-)|eukprot:CAMPEP_0181451308 /NCGR_PEP_ID=MMETSP1110-20121109/28622_1 /TAXON_ID=174948 /ORGANISM="Symbiodinium sp., Strain CCMP421" /LENGTH=679 /DNA_ID=CAMNT_0023575551 /DNA_START=140 /DNA_END=2179 /DNA_ORIENTATION=+